MALAEQADADENDLIKRASNGDKDAFSILYRAYVGRVYRYVLIRVGTEATAQDLTAQTFLAMLESIGNYRHESRFVGWVFGIARRKLADHYRKQKHTVDLSVIENQSFGAQSVEDVIGQKLTLERVFNVMETLSPDRAEALSLRIFGGLRMAEIGDVMGKSEASAKMLVHRALNDLRDRLGYLEEA